MLAVVFLVLGCGQGSSSTARDASLDNQINVSLPDLPPGCPPDGGNENGIGAPCTANGNECSGSLQCSCKSWFGYTMPVSMPCFCTNVVFGDQSGLSPCGSNASPCTYDIPLTSSTITVSACFPAICLASNQCPAITQ
jgi:hypothetical protein